MLELSFLAFYYGKIESLQKKNVKEVLIGQYICFKMYVKFNTKFQI